jgi:uncharacterized phage-associated protein
MANGLNLKNDLAQLASLRDEDIDTSDITERIDFEGAIQGKYYDLKPRSYDVRAIANWCIGKAANYNIEATSMWLNKIVYFIYEEALKHSKILLTEARVEAWDHGPVFREIYFQHSNDSSLTPLKKFDRTSRRMEIANENFAEEDLAIFEKVWERYGQLSASRLRQISHKPGTPWDIVWNYKGNANPGMVIDYKLILGQFSGLQHGRKI